MDAVVPFFFAFAAAIGIAMAVAHFRGKTTPQIIGTAHGLFAAAGLLSLLWIAIDGGGITNGSILVGLFVLVALGGLFLHYRKAKGKPWPGLVIIAHGGAALTALGLLIFWLL